MKAELILRQAQDDRILKAISTSNSVILSLSKDQARIRSKLPPPAHAKTLPSKNSVILSLSKDQTGVRTTLPASLNKPIPAQQFTPEIARKDPSKPDSSHRSARSSSPAATLSTASPAQLPPAVSGTPRNKSIYPSYTSPKISRIVPPHVPKADPPNRSLCRYKAHLPYCSGYRRSNRASTATLKAGLILRQAQDDRILKAISTSNSIILSLSKDQALIRSKLPPPAHAKTLPSKNSVILSLSKDQARIRSKLPPPAHAKTLPPKNSVILSLSKDQTGLRKTLRHPPEQMHLSSSAQNP